MEQSEAPDYRGTAIRLVFLIAGALGAGDFVRGFMEFFNERVTRMETVGGRFGAAKLVGPFSGRGRFVGSLRTLLVEQVDVPGHPAPGIEQHFGEGLAGAMRENATQGAAVSSSKRSFGAPLRHA